MSKQVDFDVAVIGAGIFGSLIALNCSNRGMKVALFEKNFKPMLGATKNNQNRLHLGYHYPRDLQTALQCKKGFDEFYSEFPEVIRSNFTNAYFISSQDSRVNFETYKDFCLEAELPFEPIEIKDFDISILNVEGGISTREVVYDVGLLQKSILKKLNNKNVAIIYNSEIKSINEQSVAFQVIDSMQNRYTARSVVNATYTNINLFKNELGLSESEMQFELTLVPIIEFQNKIPPLGITVMDGPFFTLLPFGRSQYSLLYHVDHSVLDSQIDTKHPPSWNDEILNMSKNDAKSLYKKIIKSSQFWVPEILKTEFVDFLSTVRVVLARSDDSDRRPSIIERQETKLPFYTVFSGKIDHSVFISKEISQSIMAELY